MKFHKLSLGIISDIQKSCRSRTKNSQMPFIQIPKCECFTQLYLQIPPIILTAFFIEQETPLMPCTAATSLRRAQHLSPHSSSSVPVFHNLDVLKGQRAVSALTPCSSVCQAPPGACVVFLVTLLRKLAVFSSLPRIGRHRILICHITGEVTFEMTG